MLPSCGNHPSERAGWRCASCGELCPECTAFNRLGIECCVSCGEIARPLMFSRAQLQPFNLRQLLSALRWPLTPTGLFSIFASAVLVTIFGLLGARAAFIAYGVVVAYLFQVVRHTAIGSDDFPGPEDFTDYVGSVVAPSGRMAVALAWVWVPAMIIIWNQGRMVAPTLEQATAQQALKPGGPGLMVNGLRVVTNSSGGIEVQEAAAAPAKLSPQQMLRMKQQADAAEETAKVRTIPAKTPIWAYALLFLGVAIAPMSLLALSLNTPLTVATNPIVLGGYAIKLGRDYLLMAGFCVAVVAADFGIRSGGALLPWFMRMPVNFAVLVLPFGLFRGIGLFVRARGPDLGYGSEDAYLVPALGNQGPLGTLPPEKEPDAKTRYAPIELDLEETESPLDVEHTASPAAPAPGRELAWLLAAGDVDAALQQLEQNSPAPEALSAGPWLELGKAAIQRKKARPAILALRHCVSAEPQGPFAAQAWLLAAHTYAEGLKDRVTSDKLLGELARRFPETAEGKFAASRLAK